MSSQDHKAVDTEFEHDMVRYLRDHPAFFENHQDLLAGMVLTHEAGSAVSLIERQVQVLREQKEDLKRKLQSLINTAQTNEKLNNNVNALILELLDASSLKDVISIIEKRMRADFAADAIVVKLLASGNEVL